MIRLAVIASLALAACSAAPLTDADKAVITERAARQCQTGSNLCRGGSSGNVQIMSPQEMRDAMNRKPTPMTGPAGTR